MATERSKRLQEVLNEIHKRWGSDALRPLSAVKVPLTHIPTGFPALDKMLGGGIACGRIGELCGVPTSGMTTLALQIIAKAQEQTRPSVYIDLAGIFDPGYAARCGVQLDKLLIARPEDVASGLDILHLVGEEVNAGLVILASTDDVLAAPGGAVRLNSALRKFISVLRRSGCTALLLSSSSHAPHAALRLQVSNSGWIDRGHDVSGLSARVTIVKNQHRHSGQQVELTITLDDPTREDAA